MSKKSAETKHKKTASKPAKSKAASSGRKVLDFAATAQVDSPIESDTAAIPAAASADDQRESNESLVHVGETKMAQLNLTKSDKARKGSSVVFNIDGYKGKTVRFPKGMFPNNTPPQTLAFGVNDGVFAEPKQPRAKLTKEQRAALPKLTTAEKIARAEKRIADLKAKQAKESAATLSEPANAM